MDGSPRRKGVRNEGTQRLHIDTLVLWPVGVLRGLGYRGFQRCTSLKYLQNVST